MTPASTPVLAEQEHRCPRDKTPLRPWLLGIYPSGRFLQCGACWLVFWWDGPSILDEKDAARKRSASGRLVAVTEVQCAELRRI